MTDLSISDALAKLATIGDKLFGSLNSTLSQHARLITMETAQGSDLPDSLVVEGFTGREAINELFTFNIDALSLSTSVDLKQFIGEEITLRLLQADGSRRAWHGFCTEAMWLGSDGGMARYRLRLESFLSFLVLRRDAFIFQDKDARQIVTELMVDYPQANFKWDVTRKLQSRAICTQYRETDLEFFTRLLAQDGLSWRFEHEQDGTDANAAGKTSTHAKHQLIIFDAQAIAPDMLGASGTNTLRYHAVRATECSDSINQFSATRQVQSNAVSLSSWDFVSVGAPASEQISSLAQGDLPELVSYDGAAERRYADCGDANAQNELHLQAHEAGNKYFSGAGAVRQLAAGHTFSLSQHAHYAPGNDTFTVLAVDHAATNNFDTGIARLLKLSDLERGTYRNHFICLRDVVPIVPGLSALRRSPLALGAQVALVVGLEGAPLTTERDHRIKVQFPWQRGHAPMSGGATDTGTLTAPESNAPGDETSGTWVRVSEALSGANWGSNFTPRVGTEVLVDFIEADMDRPVIVACLYTVFRRGRFRGEPCRIFVGHSYAESGGRRI
ncbi:MAG: type VI secretion system Vgr family protein [Pseudomonadota bacterium]